MKKILLTAAALVAATPAAAQTVYSNDFDAPASVAPGVNATLGGVTTVVGSGTTGLSGNFLRNGSGLQGGSPNAAASTTLTLTGLGAHTSVDINMIFGFMESWDGAGADLLDIVVDGVTRITGMTNNHYTTDLNVNYGGGTLIGSRCIQADDNNFGWCDTIVDLGTSSLLNFAHTSSTLTLTIFAYGGGWSGSTDEAWAIDNLSITLAGAPVGAVPEPATWAMMIGGFGFVGGALRRRRRSKFAIA